MSSRKPSIANRFMSMKEVCEILNISRTTVYRRIEEDETFPRYKFIGVGRRKGFSHFEVLEWMLKQ